MAAMIPNGSWIQNESGEDIEDEIRMMPIPLMDDALTGEDGKPVTYNYSGQPSFAAIPKQAGNKEGAKAFLAYSCRDDMLRLLTEVSGTPLPFDYSVEGIEFNAFQQSCIDIWKNSVTWFEDSRSPLWTGLKIRNSTRATLIPISSSITGRDRRQLCASEYAGVEILGYVNLNVLRNDYGANEDSF